MAKEKQLRRYKRECFYIVLKSEYLELGSEKAVGY